MTVDNSPDLHTSARQLCQAREALNTAWLLAQHAALAALEAGDTESNVARVLGVDRMTVRKWQGKR